MIKAVIFDLGRVLIDVDLKRGIIGHLSGSKNKDDQEIISEVFQNDLFILFSTGKISPEEIYYAMTERYQFDFTYESFVSVWCDIFSPIEGMERVVEKLGKEYPLGLLSDTDPLHWNYVLKSYPFLRQFKSPVLSYEIGALKPAPVCYDLAAKSVNARHEECLFIDDRDINVEGAIKAGMQAIRFQGPSELETELKKRKLLW